MAALTRRPRTFPHRYRGRAGKALKDIYDTDHAETRQGGRFRWMVSTCLAATVGAVAIFVVIYGSADRQEIADGFLPALEHLREGSLPPPMDPVPRSSPGLKWAVPKSDRLVTISGGASTRYIIHESLKQRRGGRDYIHAKPYARIVARLAPVPSDYADVIPPFNPFKLYANNQPLSSNKETREPGNERPDVSVRVVELLGGILPGEDGQELDAQEVSELVERAQEAGDGTDTTVARLDATASQPLTLDAIGAGTEGSAAEPVPPNTTVQGKSAEDGEDIADDLAGREIRVVKVGPNDTLAKILTHAGADTWQASSMVEAARSIFPESALAAGQEVRVTLVPSLIRQNQMEPAGFAVFSNGHEHKVTVTRNTAGEFIATGSPFSEAEIAQAVLGDSDQPQSSSLYASVYYSSLRQKLAPEAIMQIMRIHAYDTDFRRRLRPGDSVEFFFDIKDDSDLEAAPGELLATAITAGAETSRFYRFRTDDGVVDYYDAAGNTSKKFLMRRPVRADDARITSGYGVRFHPLLNEKRMHTGVDWACAPGTPILAAGNGVIEEAGRKGQYGNYIRIRHPNGYHTAYGHMQRFADGAQAGVKVRQGQVIGFVGSTGLSSGPHVHFEVLVNSRFVDPMSIEVPRERKLEGKQFAEFQKERARIEELLRRAPVKTASK